MLAILSLLIGSTAAWFIAARGHRSMSDESEHTIMANGAHQGCMRVTREKAKTLVEAALRSSRHEFIKAQLAGKPVESVEFEAFLESTSRHDILCDVYVNKNQHKLWQFAVDHASGRILDIHVLDVMSKSEVTERVKTLFISPPPALVECTVKPGSIFEVLEMTAGEQWLVKGRIESRDGVWYLTIGKDGELIDAKCMVQ